jgi:hypothetical protein
MKKVVCLGLLVLMVMPLVLASVDLSIKTSPNHRISVILRGVGELSTLDSFHKDTLDGNVAISSFITKSEVDIHVILKSQDVQGNFIKMAEGRFDGVPTGEVININIMPGEVPEIVDSFEEEVVKEEAVEEEVEESPEEEHNHQIGEEEVVKEEAEITGDAVGGIGSFNSKTIYYIVGAVLLLLIGFYLVKYKKKMDKKGSGFKVVNLGESDNEGDKDDYEDRFSDAEKKIEEAREALSKLK